jgi:hypothetical protein
MQPPGVGLSGALDCICRHVARLRPPAESRHTCATWVPLGPTCEQAQELPQQRAVHILYCSRLRECISHSAACAWCCCCLFTHVCMVLHQLLTCWLPEGAPLWAHFGAYAYVQHTGLWLLLFWPPEKCTVQANTQACLLMPAPHPFQPRRPHTVASGCRHVVGSRSWCYHWFSSVSILWLLVAGWLLVANHDTA